MREKRNLTTEMEIFSRITPAYAGKTFFLLVPRWNCRDHPRVCGKNLLSYSVERPISGSPPRMREKHLRAVAKCHIFGITPAYAGKTLKDPNEIKTFLSF